MLKQHLELPGCN